MNVSPFGWLYLATITGFLPWAAIRSARRVRQSGRTPTRQQHLTSVAVSQAGMLVLALGAARSDFVWLFPPLRFGPANLAIVAAFLVPTLGTLPWRWRLRPEAQRRRIAWMYPQCPGDLWWWALVSLAAGTVEEIAYRGVMVTLWGRVLGSWWAAVAVCVAAFALAHFVQGTLAMSVIVLFTVALHGIVRITGDLYTVMAAHVLYDFFAGVIMLRLLRPEPVPAVPVAD
jgi:membrane protease YdiL (CAAX protease family)